MNIIVIPESDAGCKRGVTSVILTSSSLLSGLCTPETSIQCEGIPPVSLIEGEEVGDNYQYIPSQSSSYNSFSTFSIDPCTELPSSISVDFFPYD